MNIYIYTHTCMYVLHVHMYTFILFFSLSILTFLALASCALLSDKLTFSHEPLLILDLNS